LKRRALPEVYERTRRFSNDSVDVERPRREIQNDSKSCTQELEKQ